MTEGHPLTEERECSINFEETCNTSTQQTDGAEQPCLCIIHLQGKELVGKGEDQVGERTEAGIVHLGSV